MGLTGEGGLNIDTLQEGLCVVVLGSVPLFHLHTNSLTKVFRLNTIMSYFITLLSLYYIIPVSSVERLE